MFNLLTQSYWRDEAFSILLAGRPLKEIFGLIVRFDHSPPLFYYLQYSWIRLFGDGEIAARSLPLLFHCLTGYFAYRLTKSRLIALMVLSNPFLWLYAFEARQYSAYAALVLGAVYFYQTNQVGRSVLLWSASLLTHNFAWLYYGVFLVFTRNKKLLFALVPGLLWLPFLLQQLLRFNQGLWIKPPTGLFFIDSLKVFFLSELIYPARPVLDFLAVFGMLGALIKLNENKTAVKLFFLAVFPAGIIYLLSVTWVSLYVERYLLASVPLLIAAFGLSLKKTRLANLFAWSYLAVSIVAIGQISRLETKPGMAKAVGSVAAKLEPEAIVITEQPINYLEVYYYLRRFGHQDRLYSYLYPGEKIIPYYVGTDLVKPQAEILAVPENRPFWLIKPDGSVVKYE